MENYNGKGIALLEYRYYNITSYIIKQFSHYLEYYLWPNFTQDASYLHYLSMIIMVNEKFKDRSEAWTVSLLISNIITLSLQVFIEKPTHFPDFLRGVLQLALYDKNKPETIKAPFLKGAEINIPEKCAILTFLQNCFNSVVSIYLSSSIHYILGS